MQQFHYPLTLFLFIFSFSSIQAQFYQDNDGDGLGSAWHPNTSPTGVLNNLDADDSDASIGLSFSLPPSIYGIIGDSVKIRYRNLLFVENANLDSLNFHIECTDPSSINSSEQWTCAPSTPGTYPISMVITKGTDTLGMDTSTLYINSDTYTGTNEQNIIMFGHSYISGGWQLHYLKEALNNGNNPNYALRGTQSIWVDPNIFHEGYGGLGWDFFTSSTSPITDGTPFGFDMQSYYDTCNAGYEPELLVVELDVNDFIFNSSLNQTFTDVLAIDTVILNQWDSDATPVINALTSFGCTKVAITIPPPPSTNPSQAGSSNAKLMQLIQKRIAVLGKNYWSGREAENIYFIPTNSAINTDTEYEDLIHPSNAAGYDVVAKQVYSWLKHEFQNELYCADRTVSWVGTIGDWNQASNWDCNCIPTSYDAVSIDGIGMNVGIPNGFMAEADSISITNSAQLNIDTTGLLQVGSRGIQTSSDSELLVEGSLIMNEGDLQNDGLLDLQNGSISGSGTLINTSSATFTGTGLISLKTEDLGILSPTANQDSLVFIDSLQKVQGNYEAILISESDYSRLKVTDTTALTNELEVVLQNGFSPQVNDSFDIFHFPVGYTGIFQPVTLPNISPLFWQLEYLPTTLRLRANVNLPIELLSFSGKNIEEGIELQWTTATETNTKTFEIQRGTKAGWQTFGSLSAAGYSKEKRQYTSLDKAPTTGSNLYRLKIIDFDNSYRFSPIIELDYKAPSTNWWLSKDTSQHTVNLHWESDANTINVAVYTIDGKLLFKRENVSVVQGERIELSVPVNAVYIVRIATQQGISSQKI